MGVLRTLLAISVVISHTSAVLGFELIGGTKAVQLFFIISGFYMSLVLNEKYKGKASVKIFYKSRLFRLFPTYFLILFIQIIICVIALSSHPDLESPLSLFLNNEHDLSFGQLAFLGFENAILFGQESILFMTLDGNSNFVFTSDFLNEDVQLHKYLFIPQAWSVSVELGFYLIAPFLLRKGMLRVIAFLILTIGFSFYLFQLGLYHDPWNYRFLPGVLPYFLLGYLGYRFYKILLKLIEQDKYARLFKIAGFGMLALDILIIIFYYKLPVVVPNDVKLILFVILFALSVPIIFLLTKSVKWDRYIGELSYSIYLSHLLIVFVVSMIDIDYAESGWLIVLLTIVFCVILHEAFAKPLEKMRQKRISQQLKSADK